MQDMMPPEIGLGNPGQPQGNPSQPQGNPGQPQVRRATPEEQQMYNRYVGLAMTLLYDDKFMNSAIKMMKNEKTTMEGVASVASLVAFQVYSEGKRQGQEIPASVVVHAGMEIIMLVVELALAAGMEPMSDKEIELAHYGAADQFRDRMEAAGHISPEQIKQDRQMMQAMHDDGRLAQTMAAIQAAQSQAPQGGPVANPQKGGM